MADTLRASLGAEILDAADRHPCPEGLDTIGWSGEAPPRRKCGLSNLNFFWPFRGWRTNLEDPKRDFPSFERKVGLDLEDLFRGVGRVGNRGLGSSSDVE